MAYAYEAQESPIYHEDGSLDRTWIIEDCLDASQAAALAMGANSPTYEGRGRVGIAPPERLGVQTFKATIKHEYPPGQNPQEQTQNNEPPQGIIEFDTSGGTQHITTAVVNQWHYPSSAPNMKSAIGVHGDSVDGVDIIVPKLQLTITKHFPLDAIDGTYIKNLARLTGKTNQVAYTVDGEEYDPGELLMAGASGSCRGRPDWEITLRIEASENIDNYTLPGTSITINEKRGHDYLWVRFKGEESSNNLVQVPEFAYVARVYREADFKAVLGF